MPNIIPVTNIPLSLISALSKPYQMVSVVFKTVYLFLALLALPQALAAPGATVVDLHSRATPDEILKLHNNLRASSNLPPLTWSGSLEAFASSRVNACRRDDDSNPPGASTDGLSLLTEGAHFSTESTRVWLGHLRRGVGRVDNVASTAQPDRVELCKGGWMCPYGQPLRRACCFIYFYPWI